MCARYSHDITDDFSMSISFLCVIFLCCVLKCTLIYAEAVLRGATDGDMTTAVNYINLVKKSVWGSTMVISLLQD